MDYSSLTISLIILVYGVLEYRRRETEHRLTIIRLQKGLELPLQERKPEVYKLWTTGCVAFILLVCSIMALVFVLRLGIRHGGPYLMFPLMFFPIFIVLVLMLIRDIKMRRQRQ